MLTTLESFMYFEARIKIMTFFATLWSFAALKDIGGLSTKADSA